MKFPSAWIIKLSVRCLVGAGLVLLGTGPAPLRADEPGQKSEDGRSEQSRRQKILESDAWRRTADGLDEWLSAQPLYDAREVAKIKNQLAERENRMSADDLEAFQHDLDAKLSMVLGPQGRDLLGWVEANLAVAAPAYRKQMGLDYPDVLKLTAAQLRERLDLLARKRSSAQNQAANYEQSRQTRITTLQAEQRQQFDERQRALDRAAASHDSSAYRSPYHPGGVRKYSSEYVPFYGWGWGFGFW